MAILRNSDPEAAELGFYTSPDRPSDWSRKMNRGLIRSSELSSPDWPSVLSSPDWPSVKDTCKIKDIVRSEVKSI